MTLLLHNTPVWMHLKRHWTYHDFTGSYQGTHECQYAPEDCDFAISTVISQCELWTDNAEPRKEEKLYKYVSEIELSKVAENTVSYGEK